MAGTRSTLFTEAEIGDFEYFEDLDGTAPWPSRLGVRNSV